LFPCHIPSQSFGSLGKQYHVSKKLWVKFRLTLGVFGIGWAIDVIRILFMSSISKNKQPYYTGDEFPHCTIGIKTQESKGSFLGDLGNDIGGTILDGMSSETIKWFYRLLWRDKYGRPLLRFDQKSLT
jgi:hypothetical protein